MSKRFALISMAALATLIASQGRLSSSVNREETLKELAEERINIAKKVLDDIEYEKTAPPPPGGNTSESLVEFQVNREAWVRRLMEARLDASGSKAERLAAIREYLKDTEKLFEEAKALNVSSRRLDLARFEFSRVKSLLIKETQASE